MMKRWQFKHMDTNGDGIDDAVIVLSKDYDEPLMGDADGVRMAQIDYIPSRPESVARAEEVARMLVQARDYNVGMWEDDLPAVSPEDIPDPDEYGDGDLAWYQMATRH